jgi:hypothetical protein
MKSAEGYCPLTLQHKHNLPCGHFQLTIGRREPNTPVPDIDVYATFENLEVFDLKFVKVHGRLVCTELLHVRMMIVENDFQIEVASRVWHVSTAYRSIEATIGQFLPGMYLRI